MSKIWFLFYDENTTGPFTSEEIQSRIAKPQVASTSFIWAKGQRRWLTPAEWQRELPEFIKRLSENLNDAPIWYVKHNDQNFGPVPISELTKFLDSLDGFALEEARIWTVGAQKWGAVFEFPQVAERMGIERRVHQRVPLNDSVVISKNGMEQITNCITISVGGLGVSKTLNLSIGDVVKLSLRGQHFDPPIYCQAVVRYTRGEEVGLKFQNITLESRARILDYIKKFNIAVSSGGSGSEAA